MNARTSAASVRARLVTLARERGQQAELMMTRYAVERLLYRLSVSRYRDHFLLKGALLFDLWFEQSHRPTRDADLLGRNVMEAEAMAAIFREVADLAADDGVQFDATSVNALDIRQQANYPGLRITLTALLASAKLKVQVDIGFGDALTLPTPEVMYPSLLYGIAAPRLRVYPKETVLAEKLHILVTLGIANTRLKDYFDLWVLSQRAIFDFTITVEAVVATFVRRNTKLPQSLPLGLDDEFASDPAKQAQWRGFLNKAGLDAPRLDEVVTCLRSFLWPLIDTAADSASSLQWRDGGPWMVDRSEPGR